MVKPSRTMQPEAIDLAKAGREAGKAFEEDSFRNYLGRKIHLQRQQKAAVVPPPNNVEKAEVHFAPDVKEPSPRKSKKSKGVYGGALKNLKRKFGRGLVESRKRAKRKDESNDLSVPENSENSPLQEASPLQEDSPENVTLDSACTSKEMSSMKSRQDRQDLFFSGVVIKVNGYTDPDASSLQRLLHKHGGDVEQYQTTRVTHIIAEHLSDANAKNWKKQKNPVPICLPSWIVESIKEMRLLPYADFLIEEVRELDKGVQSVATFFTSSKERGDSLGTLEKSPNDQATSSLETNVMDNTEEDPACTTAGLDADEEKGEIATMQSTNEQQTTSILESTAVHSPRRTDNNSNGGIRTVGNDPNFLESFFAASRLSFIGSFKQRERPSPSKKTVVSRVRNKRRFVLHVDMDCFFAAVVLRNFPEYIGKPVAISHHGKRSNDGDDTPKAHTGSTSECATCNYEARKFGIKKGMYLGSAKQLCPDLVVLPYDFEGYEEVSEQVAGKSLACF
jgi:DNA repair protein REV1